EAKVLGPNENHLRVVPCRGPPRGPGREGAVRRSHRKPRILSAARGAAPRVASIPVLSRRRALDRGPPARPGALRVSPAPAARGPRGEGHSRAPRGRPAPRAPAAGARPAAAPAAASSRPVLLARLYRRAVPASLAPGAARATGSAPRSGRTTRP